MDLRVGVAQQGEGQVESRLELHVGLRVVPADPDYDRALRREIREGVTERARLDRASGRVVPGVEVQDDLLPAEVLQGHLATVVRDEPEVRRRLSLFDHTSTVSGQRTAAQKDFASSVVRETT